MTADAFVPQWTDSGEGCAIVPLLRERRLSLRYPFGPEAACYRVEEGGGLSRLRVINISTGGLALLLRHCPEPMALWTLELHCMTHGHSQQLHAQVAYTIKHPSGDWLVGCAFLQPLNEAELKVWLW